METLRKKVEDLLNDFEKQLDIFEAEILNETEDQLEAKQAIFTAYSVLSPDNQPMNHGQGSVKYLLEKLVERKALTADTAFRKEELNVRAKAESLMRQRKSEEMKKQEAELDRQREIDEALAWKASKDKEAKYEKILKEIGKK
ncbi:MAG: hypothetical protein AAGI07_07770 [Bacteroidota bacterium]